MSQPLFSEFYYIVVNALPPSDQRLIPPFYWDGSLSSLVFIIPSLAYKRIWQEFSSISSSSVYVE
ncbi:MULTISPECIES: hypothetical protein [unclassified Colwellia]|uniref:hypothetical protein n=1 Tax=unclassified Colwellia TaxID=196834 RepID=UPI0015F6FFD0|nr:MULTISPECIES: hypothetical protein [unclassified Colwellia]MBA6233811.1 hypothetical protein [Colwellia sp. MB02u-7]MBA6237373.1 hypothetical protein [Colwellia sp. MB02u-11]MBA6300373.1 hypothetical protein [Colwellia sp. MB3u-22]MBA6310964.1 hypothetical protein [Colwellia sp. MB3u-64]